MSKYVCIKCGLEVVVAALIYLLDDAKLPVQRCVNQDLCPKCAGIFKEEVK